MKLVTFQRRSCSNRAGIITPDGNVLDLSRAFSTKIPPQVVTNSDTSQLLHQLRGLSSSLLEIIRGGDVSLTACYELAKDCAAGEFADLLFPMGDATLLSPLPAPPTIIHFETNFLQIQAENRHIHGEGAIVHQEWFQYPCFNYGSPHLVNGTDAVVQFPEQEHMIDYELELAAVLGEAVHDACVEDAEDAILGYMVANDWTARALQRDLSSYAKHKSIATTLGPWIITKDQLRDPYNLKTSVQVNGKTVGEGSTATLQFSFPEMISYASEGVFLPAGTVILSGAVAAGSGLLNGQYLNPGDQVDLMIEKIGSLRNRVHERLRPPVFRGSMADDKTH
jgi:2-keto-4-pentenoate hydratase/2-oxohepta-3-ene-1,7-dioic acid hydratase in catechol pathway